jgi:hypothetical protein
MLWLWLEVGKCAFISLNLGAEVNKHPIRVDTGIDDFRVPFSLITEGATL